MGKVECKKYPKAARNSTAKEQERQVRKLEEQKASNPPTSSMVKIDALKAKLRIHSQLEGVMSRRKMERLLKNQHKRETEGNLQ